MKGRNLELHLINNYGFQDTGKANTKATESGDLIKDGNHHQIKGDGGTMANNHHRPLGNNIVEEFTQLVQDDYSQYFTLGLKYRNKHFLAYTFDKQQIVEMVRARPEIIRYDYNPKTKATTIRIAVKIKHDTHYSRYCESKIKDLLA